VDGEMNEKLVEENKNEGFAFNDEEPGDIKGVIFFFNEIFL
jgi:hypothetical protein